MCAGASREVAFWEALHATTTRPGGPAQDRNTMMASASAVNDASKGVTGQRGESATSTPDDGETRGGSFGSLGALEQYRKSSDAVGRGVGGMGDTYGFLSEVEGGGEQFLPFLQDVGDTVR
jgi:hypothetical protein